MVIPTSSITRGPPACTRERSRELMRRTTTPELGGAFERTKISPQPPVCDAASSMSDSAELITGYQEPSTKTSQE